MEQNFRGKKFDDDEITDFEARLEKRQKDLEWKQKQLDSTPISEMVEIGSDKTLEAEEPRTQKSELQKYAGITIPVEGVVEKSPQDFKSSMTGVQAAQNASIDALDVDALVDEVSAEDADLAQLAADSKTDLSSDPDFAHKILQADLEAEGIPVLRVTKPRDPAGNPAWNLLDLKTGRASAKELGLEQTMIDLNNRGKHRVKDCTLDEIAEVIQQAYIAIAAMKQFTAGAFYGAAKLLKGKTEKEKKEFFETVTADTKEKRNALVARRAAKPKGNGAVSKPKAAKVGLGKNQEKFIRDFCGAGSNAGKKFARLRESMKEEGTWTPEHDHFGVTYGFTKQGE